MITKERLDELIKEGATVWSSTLECEITLNKKCYVYLDDNNSYRLFVFDDFGCEGFLYLEDLEEDAETTKFKLKYQNITRTDTLSLPTYQEVNNERVYEQYFCNNIGNNFYFGIANYGTYPTISVTCVNDFRNKYKPFEKKFTKTNFYKACELCRKLFLGKVE